MARRVGTTVLLLAALLGPRPLLAQKAAPTPAAPVVVTTRVDPKTVTIGTPFRYTMRVEATGDVELVVPVLAERIGDFSITDFGQVPRHKENGHLVVERWYTLVTYETGDKLVPGPTVQYRVAGSDLQRVDAPDALVTVRSLVDKAGGMKAVKDVHDIKGPVAVPRDYRPLWWSLAALLVLVGAGAGLYWLLNRSRRKRWVAPPPPHEIALEALARLRASRLLESERHGEYYVRLSGIVRTYLEGRFKLRAPEMTSEEFLQAAQRNPQLAASHRTLLAQFLADADLVKFARYLPAAEDAERAWVAARQFVESTAEKPEENRAAA